MCVQLITVICRHAIIEVCVHLLGVLVVLNVLEVVYIVAAW